MNHRERVLATLAGQKVDRRPVAPLLSLYGARLTNCPVREYFSDAKSYALGQAAVFKTFSPDILFAPFAFAQLGEAFGSELHFFEDQNPNIRRPAIYSAKDINKITVPDPDTHPRLKFFFDSVRRMVDAHGGEVLIAAPIPGPADFPPLIMGIEAWMETILFDPESAQKILDLTTRFVVAFSNRLFDAGAAFGIFPAAFFTPSVLTRDLVINITRPATIEALKQIKGPIVMHHGGGPLGTHMDLLIGLPNMAAVALDENDSIVQARSLFGPQFPLMAGKTGPTFPGFSADEIKKSYLHLMTENKDDPFFIMYSCGADIPLNTPPENIMAMRIAAESTL